LVVPGDVVTVSGVVKSLTTESLQGRGSRSKGKGRESSLLIMVIEANAIENKSVVVKGDDGNDTASRQAILETQQPECTQDSALQYLTDSSQRKQQKEKSRVFNENAQKNDIVANLTDLDFKMIVKAQSFGFEFLVYSLCPLILGHEHVKAGLLLALAGGTNSAKTGKNAPIVRGDAHVLVVGDPGLGKSQMLKACATVSPRGVYVCGNTTSKSGLTVSMNRDNSGEHSLEAGALVLADRGVCCIDEFDKIQYEHAALLEAMEQQMISVAKAGIVCSLSARTAILAAANPIGGHYNRSKTILENLRMSSPLLSRFDLVFILVDKPSTGTDERIADYVVDMHVQKRRKKSRKHKEPGRAKITASSTENLREYLRQKMGEFRDPLPPEMLRKYLAFARHYCHPKLSRPACKILQGFYLELRRKGAEGDSTPITTRQLESLIRLAQARAKLELRDIVTENDAKEIVSLMRDSLLDAFTDDIGVVDYQRSAGMSMSKVCKTFITRLNRVSKQEQTTEFTKEQLKNEAQISKVLDHIPNFDDFISILNDQSYIIKKKSGIYKLM